MSVTKEDLELAAWVMQKTKHPRFANFSAHDGGVVLELGCQRGAVTAHWNPSTNYSDAAHMADHLRMYVDARGTAVQAKLYAGDQWTRVEREGNPNAWCEAVTLCAAQEGRRMRTDSRASCKE